ncbi:MAG TPA: protease pro-enzyme activation domain-containing protein, partial [Galbitalea sp.]|nr:protease pro-enzyme activation domain-containing protein [Galbitalea sp.]
MTDSELHPTSDHLVLVPLPGSERPAAEGIAPAAVSIDHEGTIEVTIILRRRASMSTDDALEAPLSSEEVAARFGADPADAALVGVTLTALGLRVLSTDLASRRVRVSGTVADIGRVFGTSVSAGTAQAGSATHRIRTGGLSIPAQLDGIITAVLGIDDRPQARAQFRVSSASAASVSYTPVQLGELYKFPAGTDGTGQTIAIIELGGGYETADLKTYFGGLGVGSP